MNICATTAISSNVHMIQGESERAVKLAFKHVMKHPPSCIFIDEIDSLGRSREVRKNFETYISYSTVPFGQVVDFSLVSLKLHSYCCIALHCPLVYG